MRIPVPGDRAAHIGIVVTGDNHLSPTLPRLSPQRRAERREWLRRGFQAAVDYAISHDAALFINTGDLFDNPAPSNQDRAFVAEQLARLRQAGVVSVAIGGNHDTPRMQTEHGGEAPHQVYSVLEGFHYYSSHDTLIPHIFTLRGLRVAVAGLSNNPVAPPGSNPLATAGAPDSHDALTTADTGIVILHAAVEGLSRPNEGERTIALSSIRALPPEYHLVVAGHIHRFARQRVNDREIVIIGATERMEFGHASGEPGFAWIELGAEGALRVEHIRTEAQPRADVSLSVADLWPAGTLDSAPLERIRAALEPHSSPETMARLRLTGELTRDRYHELALRDIVLYGQQRFFSLDIDTSGLTIHDPALALPDYERDEASRSPVKVIQATVDELLARGEAGEEGVPQPEDVRMAGALLLRRLREVEGEGA